VFSALTLILACVYAFIRRNGKLFSRIFVKTAASLGFVLLAVSLQIRATEPYFTLILIGLVFALAGDVLLLFTDRSSSYLACGAVCFFMTHLFYTTAFITKAPLSLYDAALFAALILLAILLVSLRGIRLKKLKIGVVLYATALCAMLARALSLLINSQMSETFAIFVALGGTLFVVSDALLAVEALGGRHARAAGTISTFAYYSSQILIALSVAL
jgi:uncharacterized membrane protein YhhN